MGFGARQRRPRRWAAPRRRNASTQVDRNRDVSVPTLVLAGEFDTMSLECSQQVVDSIPTAWPLVVIPRAAHCKLLDEPVLCAAAVAKFLHTCDRTRDMGSGGSDR